MFLRIPLFQSLIEISYFPGATRFAPLSACPWLSYFAPLALRRSNRATAQALSCFDGFGGFGVAANQFTPGGAIVVKAFG